MASARKIFLLLLMFVVLAKGASTHETLWEDLLVSGQSAFEAGAYDQASRDFSAALRIAETYSELDLRLATTLNNLAAAYFMNGDYAAAEPLFRRALSINERSLGGDSAQVGTNLNNLAALDRKQGNPAAAVRTLERTRNILKQALGSTHPRTSAVADRLAAVRHDPDQSVPSQSLLPQDLGRRQPAAHSDPAEEAPERRGGADVGSAEALLSARRDVVRSADEPDAQAPQPNTSAAQPDIAGQALPYLDYAQAQQTSAQQRELAHPNEGEPQQTALAALPGTMEGTGQGSHEPALPEIVPDADASNAAVDVIEDEVTSGPSFYLQLMSVPIEDRARTEWSRLRLAHADVLAKLGAHVVRADLDDRGVWYRLQAGPLASFSLATKACARLAHNNQDCLVVKR